jgi:hypothetical protein
MRYLAVGDIHGCFKALTTLATFVPFQADFDWPPHRDLVPTQRRMAAFLKRR